MKRKNSKPWQDLELREAYREEWGDACELTPYLAGPLWDEVKLAWGWRWDKGIECHHIYHVGARYDVLENLIMTCVAAHRFCHLGPAGLIACWYAKWKKGEFNPEEMKRFMGRCPLGLIESKLAEVDEHHYARMGRELLG